MQQMTVFAPRFGSMPVGLFCAGAFVFTLAAIPLRASGLTFTTIDVPGATATSAFRINARGQIVGGYVGTFVTIDFPGPSSTDALGINAAGQIVGRYADASGTLHGFLLDQGAFTTIDPPGSIFTQAIGINTRGQIVGDYQDASGMFHGFLAAR